MVRLERAGRRSLTFRVVERPLREIGHLYFRSQRQVAMGCRAASACSLKGWPDASSAGTSCDELGHALFDPPPACTV